MNELTLSDRDPRDQDCCFRRVSSGALRIVLEISRDCSRKCLHCFVPNSGHSLPAEFWVSVLNQIRESRNTAGKVILTGGEPLIHPDWERIATCATVYGFSVDLNTNLDIFSPEVSKKFRSIGISEISTSLHGDAAFHDWLSGTESFKRTLCSIYRAIEDGLVVDVHGICVASNWKSYRHLCKRLNEIGVASMTLLELLPTTPNRSNFQSFNEVEKRKFREWVRDFRVSHIGGMSLRTRGFGLCSHSECTAWSGDVLAVDSMGILLPCLQTKYENAVDRRACDLSRTTVWQAEGHMKACLGKLQRQCYVSRSKKKL